MGDEGVSQLVESFPEGVVVVDPARTEKHRHDWARYSPAGRPMAVGLPEPTRGSLVTVGAFSLGSATGPSCSGPASWRPSMHCRWAP
jgi:hypothetical protein